MTNSKENLLISTFTLGDLQLAVEALMVQEIIRVPSRTVVYLSSPEIWGVINLRGKIVTVWDLGPTLGLKSQEITEDSRIIVIKFDDESVGLLVDGINDVMEIKTSEIHPTPGNVDERQARYFQGIFGESERLISVLDLKLLEKHMKG